MANYGNSYTIRSFRDWGAVYRYDERVLEGDIGHCIDYVLEQTGVTHEKDCAFIAKNGRAAESLHMARQVRHSG